MSNFTLKTGRPYIQEIFCFDLYVLLQVDVASADIEDEKDGRQPMKPKVLKTAACILDLGENKFEIALNLVFF